MISRVSFDKKTKMLLKYVFFSAFDHSRIEICNIMTVNMVLHNVLGGGYVC